MAIATLDKCFNNHDVFTGVVKVRKGLAVAMIVDSKTLPGVEMWFRTESVLALAEFILSRVDCSSPPSSATHRASFSFLMVLASFEDVAMYS